MTFIHPYLTLTQNNYIAAIGWGTIILQNRISYARWYRIVEWEKLVYWSTNYYLKWFLKFRYQTGSSISYLEIYIYVHFGLISPIISGNVDRLLGSLYSYHINFYTFMFYVSIDFSLRNWTNWLQYWTVKIHIIWIFGRNQNIAFSKCVALASVWSKCTLENTCMSWNVNW